ncbi:hypothetical protein Tsubulata_021120 [Turnera subulata]|uniref:Protein kinase domain-containing protein n=1 Tax=Turnera subulata TaxID=218843 RepID=A0A9Q0FVS7_9ROSI|nr:hypothetical protein Tsubulata_021120 [Turnera subulata]
MISDHDSGSHQRYLRRRASTIAPHIVNANGDMTNFCVLTGEEFSTEFLHDRAGLRPVPYQNQPGHKGFNYCQNPQMVYQDPAVIHGSRRKNSECDALDFVPMTGHGYDAENRAYPESISRYNWDYSQYGGRHPSRYGDEMAAADRVASGTATPKIVDGYPQFFPHLETGVSVGAFSNKMKFLCSFGGRILPRPNDGKLRYVGGETRILSLRRNIRWEELVKKTSGICNQAHTIKYQLPGEDLDALISVTSDEDLHNMTEEYLQLERRGGSQKLRIFLVPTSEPQSPNSFEHQTDADYHYVAAVNSMVDSSSPAKGLSSKRSLLRTASGVGVESPTPVYLDSPTSSNYAGPAGYFFTPFHVQGKSLCPSPPLSPVTVRDIDHNISSVLPAAAGDSIRAEANQSPRVVPLDNIVYDNLYYPNAYNDVSHVPFQMVNGHHPSQYVVESDQRNEQLGLLFHRRTPSGEFLPHQFMPQTYSNADRNIGRTYSGSRLEAHGRGPQRSFEDEVISKLLRNYGRENSASPPELSNSSREGPNWHEITTGKNNQDANREYKHCLQPVSNFYLNQEASNCSNIALSTSKEEGNARATSNDKAMILEDLQNLNDRTGFPYYRPQDSQESSRVVYCRTANTLEDSGYATKEHPHVQRSSAGDSDKFIEGQTLTRTQTCEIIVDQPVTYMLSGHISSTSQELDNQQQCTPDSKSATNSASSRVASLGDKGSINCSDCKIGNASSQEQSYEGMKMGTSVFARYSISSNDERDYKIREPEVTGPEIFQSLRSQPLNDDQGTLVPEPVITVEDVTGTTIPDIPESSKVVPIIEEEPAHEFQSDGAAEGESSGEEFEFKVQRSSAKEGEELISDAAMAEIEAGIYGLQIIKDSDIEEVTELGSGTFGTVYFGKWRGTDVAIKRIKNSCFCGRSSEQERLIKDFWREARILSTLHHPNVLAFYGIVPDGPDGTMATVTEYLVDGSLRRVLQKKGRALDRRKKLAIALDAAFGMEYLHVKDIIHFDLKCDNLLVNLKDSHRPVCKVADFGLSKIKRNTLVSGGVRGTLPWMAPELLDGNSNRVSEKVDVFSFGVAMWEIQTGEEPYADMHCGAIIGGIVSNTLRPPIPANCDPEWRKLMEECWSFDPESRPSFTEIRKRLRAMSMAVQPRRHNLAVR